MKHFKVKWQIVCIVLLLFMNVQSALADVWSKLPNLTNYAVEPVGDVYHIKNANELAWFAWKIQTDVPVIRDKMRKSTIEFDADIDLAGHEWEPLAQNKGAWEGTIQGNGHAIKNMYVSTSTSENCNGGFLDLGAGNFCVKNLRFENALIRCKEYTGILVGRIENSGFTVEDVTISNSTINGDTYLGGIIGWVKNCNGFTINNVRVEYSHFDIWGNGSYFAGGIVGEFYNAEGTVKNCFAAFRPINYATPKQTGGIVGKIISCNNININNCVTDINENFFTNKDDQGGIVGFATENSVVRINNCVVLANYNSNNKFIYNGQLFYGKDNHGLIIGCNSGNSGRHAHVDINNCAVDEGIDENNLEKYIAGSFCYTYGKDRYYVRNMHRISTECNLNSLKKVVKMNEAGACLGYDDTNNSDNGYITYIKPLKDTKGKLVSFNYEKYADLLTSVQAGNILWNQKSLSKYTGIGVTGMPTTYNVQIDDYKWILQDKTTNVNTQKRLGATSLSHIPANGDAVTLNLKIGNRPKVAWKTTPQYDNIKQTVSMQWDVADRDELFTYWKGAKWIIERNGKQIKELALDTMNWTDTSLDFDEPESVYKLYLECDSLKYTKEHNITSLVPTYTVKCTYKYNIKVSQPKTDDKKVYITATMPNAKLWDKCRMRLLRWNSITEEDTQNDDEALLKLADSLTLTACTKQFSYNSAGGDEVSIVFEDSREQARCDMWRYMVVCDQYDEQGLLKGQVNHSDRIAMLWNDQVKIESFTASKGANATKITLNWKVKNKYKEKIRYILYRVRYSTDDIGKTPDNLDYTELYFTDTENNACSYTDETNPGYIYRYWLKACPLCEGVANPLVFDDEAYEIGYAASRGTIMGKISYDSGNSNVEGVDVRITPDETSMEDKGTAYAMYFNEPVASMPLAGGLGESFWKKDWTLQLLLRTGVNNASRRVLTLPGRFAINVQNDTLQMAGQTLPLNANSFDNHIMLIHKNGTYQLSRVDDTTGIFNIQHTTQSVTDADMKNWLSQQESSQLLDTLYIGTYYGAQGVQSFIGYTNEIRIWSKQLDEKEIKNTYNRYLTGNEMNLKAYYTFDAGVAEYVFDESHPAGIWGNHHTALPIPGSPALVTGIYLPSADVLCYRGVTDKNGEYQIAGIPFVGEGTNYMVVPMFGTHEFVPSSTRRFVSAQSMAHSDVDFTDKSSFPVTIQATYAFGNYPVKGLRVTIDGASVTRGENIIETNEEGQATVNVPIGKHKLKLAANGHIMLNNGYPCSITSISSEGVITYDSLQNSEGYVDFQSTPVAPLTFYDNTFVRIAGHVVGGNEEGNKPIGVDMTTLTSDTTAMKMKQQQLSKANLGAVTLVFAPITHADKYQLNFEGVGQGAKVSKGIIHFVKKDTISNANIYTPTRYMFNSSNVQVTTDSITGQYLAFLPPIDMQVVDIYTEGKHKGGLDKKDFRLESIPAAVQTDKNSLKYDTIYLDSQNKHKHELFAYNGKKSFTYYRDPVLEVYNPTTNVSSDSLMMGDSCFVRTYFVEKEDGSKEEVDDVVSFWSKDKRDGSSDAYTVKCKNGDEPLKGYPVFTQGYTYRLGIKLYEKYTNFQTGIDTTYNMNGVKVTIHNDLSTLSYTTLNTGYALDTAKVQDVSLNTSNGILEYSFIAGYPNPLAPYLLDMNICFEANNNKYAPEAGKLRGIVTGAVPIPGASFVTAGPNMVSFVLRDPPGTNSFSWLDKGCSIGNNYTSKTGWVGNVTHNTEFASGVKTTSIVGANTAIAVLAIEEQTYGKKTLNISTENTAGTNGSTSLTYTLTDKLQTSSGGKYVGADGDVYMGVSRNYTISQCNQVGFRKVEGATPISIASTNGYYELGSGTGTSTTSNYSSCFAYSQFHIVNELIPQLRRLRQGCITQYVADLKNIPSAVPGKNGFYYVKNNVDHQKTEWKENEDYVWVVPKDHENLVDSLNLYSQWIKGWEFAIMQNEKTKYNTIQKYKSKLTYTDSEASSIFKPSIDYGFLGNVSLDAGSTMTSTISRNFTDNSGNYGSTTDTETFTFKYAFQKTIHGWDIDNKNAIAEKMGFANSWSRAKNTSRSQTFGYTLDDKTAGSFFSVNTYLPGQLKGGGSIADLRNGDKPAFDEFFVFSLEGGQSSCPYVAEEKSLYYTENGKKVQLGKGTIPVELPSIRIEDHDIGGVTNGKHVTTHITVGNTSTASVKASSAFNIRVDQENNPDGLQVFIDGQPITTSSLYQVYLMPGESVTKLVEFKPTREDVLEYKNIKLMLVSDCQPTRFATDSLRIYYKPASSPVAISQSSKVVNASARDTSVTMTINGYDMDYKKFSGIRIQYRKANKIDWNTYTVMVKDSAELVSIIGKDNFPVQWRPLEKEKMNIKVNMAQMDDAQYEFRAQSFSAISPAEEITTETEIMTVTKDTKSPELLVDPSPAYGIYTVGSEISLQFNEPINVNKLSNYNFYVQAALNDAQVKHNCGLHFNGAYPAHTSSRINIFGKSATIGMWYKPQAYKKSCLLSQTVKAGTNQDIPIKLVYNEDASLSIFFGSMEMRSQRKALRSNNTPYDDWMFATFIIDQENGNMQLFNFYDTHTESECQFLKLNNQRPNANCEVPLYVGGSTQGDSCYANIEGLVIYEGAQDVKEVYAEKDTKFANTRGLSAYWPMDEGKGNVVTDKVRARNLYLTGTDNWYLPVTNYALKLNGQNEYLRINTSKIPITKNKDYLLEFWFRSEGETAHTQTLFSNGWGGEGSAEVPAEIAKRLSISLTPKGSILLSASGKDYEMGKNYNDNNWHHLALNVQRDAYATIYVDTIDISNNSTIAGTDFGAFENSEMVLGAMKYLVNNDYTQPQIKNFFKGEIDELRIWNTHKTANTMKRTAYQRLSGADVGLIAYYPFEYTHEVSNTLVTRPTLSDRIATDTIMHITPATYPVFVSQEVMASASDSLNIYTEDGPRLKAASYRSTLAIDWTTNNTDKITFKFPSSLSKSRIENCVVTFGAKNIEDLAGNRIDEAISWNVYVQQRVIDWLTEGSSLRFVQEIGNSVNNPITIINESAQERTWSVENIPSWLKLSATTGVISPWSTQTITATTTNGTAIGNYSNTLYLTNSGDDISVPLEVSLSVTGAKPEWKVITSTDDKWMALLGRIKIADSWTTDENDIVGAFDAQGQCHALASPVYSEEMNAYFLQMNIVGNFPADNKNIYFRIWSASSGLTYTNVDITYRQAGEKTSSFLVFSNNTVLGNFAYPVVMNAKDNICQNISLHEGWNWTSLWVTPPSMNAAKVFAPVKDKIKVKARTCTYGENVAGRPLSSLTLSPALSYHIYADEDVELQIQGPAFDADTVNIILQQPSSSVSWNWIGFPVRKVMTLTEAFSDFKPQYGDVLMGQNSYAMYNGNTWIGNLKYLSPGLGYIYGFNGTEKTTWTYPGNSALLGFGLYSSPSYAPRLVGQSDNHFELQTDPYAYEDYSFVEVSIMADNAPYNHDYEIAAFTNGGKCHGTTSVQAGEKAAFAIFGDANDVFTFRLWDKTLQKEIPLDGQIYFDASMPVIPLTFSVNTVTGINGILTDKPDTYYNIQGIKYMQKPLQKGIYIKNGKKTYIK